MLVKRKTWEYGHRKNMNGKFYTNFNRVATLLKYVRICLRNFNSVQLLCWIATYNIFDDMDPKN